MPILVKEIIPEGDFLVSSSLGRKPESFSAARLNKLAAIANKMIEGGLKIPAPFDHNKDAVPIKKNDKPASSFQNAGYWEHWFVATNDEGKPVLKAAADLPGSELEPDTPYYKALNSAKEVSVNIRDEYIDGLGRKWNDAIMHAALVNHAVVPGQKGFEVPDDSYVINMSMLEDGDDSTFSIIGQIRTAMQEAFNVTLPESADLKLFLRDLLTASLNFKNNRTNTDYEPVPIYMSTGDNDVLTKEQAESIVASGAINPTTKNKYTMEDLGFKPAPPPAPPVDVNLAAVLKDKDDKLERALALTKALANKLAADTQAAIQRRIDALVQKGVITKEYADQALVPKVSFSMSIDSTTGNIADHQLELALSTLEALPVHAPAQHDNFGYNLSQDLPGAIQVPPISVTGGTGDMSADDMQKAIDEMAAFVD